MKTVDFLVFQTDPVMTELRRVKTALAAKHEFDVTAMVRSLQKRQEETKIKKLGNLPGVRTSSSNP
jgi:hypothetical protein